jgi:gliding motility-associated-like protein
MDFNREIRLFCYPRMKKYLPIAYMLVFLGLSGQVFSQSSPANDTAIYPYWLDMMADPTVNFYKTQRAFEVYWENRPIDKGSGYKPFKRWEYNTSQIIDSVGNIPAPGSIEKEFERYRRNYYAQLNNGLVLNGLGPASCMKTGNWMELGPTQIPSNRTSQPNGLGRVNAVGFHPTDSNIIYAGAPAGGFWITRDGGKSWTSNTDTLATLGVSAIAVDPVNPDTIYIGTGDRDAADSYGRGVFRSVDGGVTWTSMSSGMGNTIVGKMFVDPDNHETVIAATNAGIYRTTDAGVTWTRSIAGNFKEVEYCRSNSKYVYASTYGNTRFYRSSDNGVSFTHITSVLPTGQRRMVIGTSPADSNLVYALITEMRRYKGIYLSLDKGQTFREMSTTPNIMDYSHLGTGTSGQAWYDLDIVIDAKDASIVYVGGVNIFQSLDSGKTWKINAHWVGSGGAPAIHADQHELEIQPSTGTVYVGNDGGVYYTKDLGKSWIDISDDLAIAQIYRLGQSATVKDMVINGYQDNGTGLYDNGSWSTVMGGDGMYCAIDPQDPKHAYSNLYYGDVRRYTNGSYSGKIAANGTNGINESGGWVTPFILQEGTPSTMFIGYKNVWRSTNVQASPASGVNWTKISNNLAGTNTQNIIHLENSPADPAVLYMSKGGNNFLRTDNANAANPSWANLKAQLPNNAQVPWIEADPERENTVWIIQSNKVYESTNKGSTWTNISSGLPNIPLLCMVFDSSSEKRGMYVGTYMGVYYKDTTMTSWQWFNDNMPINTRVRDIEIFYHPDGRSKSHVVCATYGRGNWRSPLYDEDELVPVAGFEASANALCMNEVVQLLDTSENVPTRWTWKISPSGYDYIGGTDSCSQNPQVRFTSKGKFSIKLIAENCAGEDSIEIVQHIEVFDAIKPPSCGGVTVNENFSSIGVFHVEIEGKSIPSGGTKFEGGYVDMACQEIFQLKTDTTYPARIGGGTAYTHYTRAYIDFNNNGDLSDPGEMIWVEKDKGIVDDSIKIPANAVTNTLLRMRVMSDWDTIPDNPCDTLAYGQTEDYGVVLEARNPEPHFVIDTTGICEGGSIVLTDSSKGPIYQRSWHVSKYGLLDYHKVDNGPVKFNLPDTGYYYAILYLNDSTFSKRIDSIVYVAPQPKVNLTFNLGSANICEGDSFRLYNQSDYSSLVSFAWEKDGSSLVGEVDSLLFRNSVSAIHSGNYRGIATIGGCTDTSSTLNVQVNPKPVAAMTVDKSEACLTGNLFQFTFTSSISTGTLNHTLKTGDGNSIATNNPQVTYADSGQYEAWLIATSDLGCEDSLATTLQVHMNPEATIQRMNFEACANENMVDLRSISLDYTGTLTESWSSSDGNTSTGNTWNHSFAGPGNYTDSLLITDANGCSDTATEILVVQPSPSADFTTNIISSCLEDNAVDFEDNSSITAGVINGYGWDFQDGNTSINSDEMGYSFGATGTYLVQLIVESDQSCKDTVEKSVSVYPNPMLDISINDTTQCLSGHVLQFTNNSFISSGSISGHLWEYGDGNTSANTLSPDYTYSDFGAYTFVYRATSDRGCASDTTMLIQILESPNVDFSGDSVCLGEAISFTDLSTLSIGSLDAFEWRFGDGGSSTDQNPMYSYTASGDYTVELVAESNGGCRDSLTKTTEAKVRPLPSANFIHEKVGSWELQTEVQFTDQSVDASFWEWLFNGGDLNNERNPLITFTDTGSQSVWLIVENAQGCRDTLMKQIEIYPETNLFIPTSFSPNEDNLNDRFLPLGVSSAQEYRLTIYNRWGVIVFKTEDVNQGWDGNYEGEEAQPGSYLYVLELLDFNGNKVVESGQVFLSR